MSFDYRVFKLDWKGALRDVQTYPYPQPVIDLLATYYGEPWRHYHTTEHLNSMQLAMAELGVASPRVKVAAYFHDIIWLPGYPQCEEKSAELAATILWRNGARTAFVEDVQRLILATKHSGQPPADEFEAQIRDADLWTLGEPDFDKFLKTQEDVRKEFPMYDDDVYHAGRVKFFRQMFPQQIYWTVPGQQREQQARWNLEKVGITL